MKLLDEILVFLILTSPLRTVTTQLMVQSYLICLYCLFYLPFNSGSPDILSLWIPFVDVADDNGCMMVIPRERDPQFSTDILPSDQDPFKHKFAFADIKQLSNINKGLLRYVVYM